MDIHCGKIKVKLNEKEKRLAKKLEVELTKLFLNNKIIKHGGTPEYKKTGIFANIRRSLGKYSKEEKEDEEEKEFANNPLTQQEMEELFNYEEHVSPGFRKRNELSHIPYSNNLFIKPNTGEKYQLVEQGNGQILIFPIPIYTKFDSNTNKDMYIYDNKKQWVHENPQERNTRLRIEQHKKLREFKKQDDQSLAARRLQYVMTLQHGPSGPRGPSGPSGNINHYSNERERLTRNSDYELVEKKRIEIEKDKRKLAEEEHRKWKEEVRRKWAEEDEEKRRLAEEKRQEEKKRIRAENFKKFNLDVVVEVDEENDKEEEEEKPRLAEENANKRVHDLEIIDGGKRKSKKTRKN